MLLDVKRVANIAITFSKSFDVHGDFNVFTTFKIILLSRKHGTLERITKLMKEQKILDQELISFLGLPKGEHLRIGVKIAEMLITGTLTKSPIVLE